MVAQSPGAGTHAVLGSPVRISVSTGHATQAVVPDVIGMREVDAERAITAAGFRTNVVTVPTRVRSQDGVVIDQDPRAGERTDQGGTVSIAVGQYSKPGGGNGNGNGHG